MLGIELRPARFDMSGRTIAPIVRSPIAFRLAHLPPIQPLELKRLLMRQSDQNTAAKPIHKIAARCIAPRADHGTFFCSRGRGWLARRIRILGNNNALSASTAIMIIHQIKSPLTDLHERSRGTGQPSCLTALAQQAAHFNLTVHG